MGERQHRLVRHRSLVNIWLGHLIWLAWEYQLEDYPMNKWHKLVRESMNIVPLNSTISGVDVRIRNCVEFRAWTISYLSRNETWQQTYHLWSLRAEGSCPQPTLVSSIDFHGPGQTAEYSMNIHDDPALGKQLLLSAKNGFQSQFNQKMAARKAPD